MKVFTYPRTFVNNKWNINNLDDVNSSGESVTLAQRITTALPGLVFKLELNPDECVITFDIDLDQAQEATLNSTVTAHENASGLVNPATSLELIDANGSQWKITISILGVLLTEKIT